MIQRILRKIEWIKLRRMWYRNNAHNNCHIEKMIPIERVSIGKETYGLINPYFYNTSSCKLIIGNYCSIAEGVRFVFGEHNYKNPSTFPFDEFVLKTGEVTIDKGDIVIEDDVWIGMNALILSGVTIHQGAVIAAGSVVSKDVPPYAVFVGNKVLKYRFDEDTIAKLNKIDYEKLTDEDIKNNRDLLYMNVSDSFFDSKVYQKISKEKR